MHPGDPPRPSAPSLYRTIVGFPITCFLLAFLTDLAYWRTVSVLWETISVWLISVGLIVAAAAIVAGIVDLVRGGGAGLGLPWAAVLGQLVAFALSLVNVFVHSRDGYTAVVPQGLILSAVVALILVATLVAGRRVVVRRAPFGGTA